MAKFILPLLFSIVLLSCAKAEGDDCDSNTRVSRALACMNIVTDVDKTDPLYMTKLCVDLMNCVKNLAHCEPPEWMKPRIVEFESRCHYFDLFYIGMKECFESFDIRHSKCANNFFDGSVFIMTTAAKKCQVLKDASCPKKEIEANCNKEDVQKFQKFIDEQRKMNGCEVTAQTETVDCDPVSYALYELECVNAVSKLDKTNPLAMHKMCNDLIDCSRKMGQCNPKIKPAIVNFESFCHYWDFAKIEMKECFQSIDSECVNDFDDEWKFKLAKATERCQILDNASCLKKEIETNCHKSDVQKFQKFVKEQQKMNGCKVTTECDISSYKSIVLECNNALSKVDKTDPMAMQKVCHDTANCIKRMGQCSAEIKANMVGLETFCHFWDFKMEIKTCFQSFDVDHSECIHDFFVVWEIISTTTAEKCQILKDATCPKKKIEANCNKEDVQKFQKFVDEQRKMNNCDVTDQSEDIGCDSIAYKSYGLECLNAVLKVDKTDPLSLQKLCRDSMKCVRKLGQCNPEIKSEMVNLESFCHFWDFATIEMKECFESLEDSECSNGFDDDEKFIRATEAEKCHILENASCLKEIERNCHKSDVQKFKKFVEEQRKINGCDVTTVTFAKPFNNEL